MVVPAAPGMPEACPSCNEPQHKQMADDQACFRHEINGEITKALLSFDRIEREFRDAVAVDPERKDQLEEMMKMHSESLHQMTALCEKDRCRRKASTLPPAMAEEAKKIELAMEELSLSDVLDAQVKYWRRVLRQDIEIIKDIDSGVFIMADKVVLSEIFSNVSFNAIQSMQNVPDRAKRLFVSLKVEDGKCRIEVHDNGAGIKKEHQARLFQPDFTTKVDGSGLGIRICRKKAEAMEGSFDLINGSVFGEGATVKMEFPLSKDESGKHREIDAIRESTRGLPRQLCLDFESGRDPSGKSG
jgi:signal transduction histidine kinase